MTEASGKEAATFLTCEAADALRRAIGHYRIVVNTMALLHKSKVERDNPRVCLSLCWRHEPPQFPS